MTSFKAINMPEQTTFQLKDFELDSTVGTEEANNDEMNPDEAIDLDEISDPDDSLVVSDDGSDEEDVLDGAEICQQAPSNDSPMLFMAAAGPKVEKKGKVRHNENELN